jgi:hypothetical protein
VAACYLGLVVLGAVCLLGDMSGGPSAPHHADHAGKTAHSSLCAWACQAGPSAVLISFGGVSFALYLLFWSVTSPIVFFSQIAWASARPRAPPFAAL